MARERASHFRAIPLNKLLSPQNEGLEDGEGGGHEARSSGSC